jgi:hypothetical protein
MQIEQKPPGDSGPSGRPQFEQRGACSDPRSPVMTGLTFYIRKSAEEFCAAGEELIEPRERPTARCVGSVDPLFHRLHSALPQDARMAIK